MKVSYRIYFGEKAFLILNESDEKFASLQQPQGSLILIKPAKAAIIASINALDQQQVETVLLYAENTDIAFDEFSSCFSIIQAGGGLVANEKDEYLFIFRRGKWDLPKGKLDEGETIAVCALREVNEETGLENINLHDHLCKTYHVYHEKGTFILKESVWFNMTCQSGQALTPQTEEDILEIKWLKPAKWPGIYDNTFPSIKDVLEASGKLKQ